MATKKCEACDAEIGESEKECPKCGVNFEELEDAVSALDTAQRVSAKRKEAANPNCAKCGKPKHEGACAVPPPTKKKSVFANLGKALRKKAA